MNTEDVGQAFDEYLSREIGRLETKNQAFSVELEALEKRYGASIPLRESLAALKESDQVLARRLETVDWDRQGEVLRKGLVEGLARATLPADGAIAIYLSDEQAEIHLRNGKDRPVVHWRRKALLSLKGIVEDVLPPKRSSAAYPIIFSHDLEENHRVLVTAAVGALLQCILIETLRSGALEEVLPEELTSLTYGYGRDRSPSLTWSSKRPLWWEFIDAVALGFRPEREFSRTLADYGDTNPMAHWADFVEARRRGPRETVELVDPAGRALGLVLDRPGGRVFIRHRDASDLIRKRNRVYVEPSAVEEEIFEADDEAILETVFDERLRESIEKGYRIVGDDDMGGESLTFINKD